MAKISYDDLYQKAVEILTDNEDVFNDMCDQLDSWDGFLGDDRYYPMDEFDELLDGRSPLEIAQLVEGNDFNTSDDYFKFTIYGVESAYEPDYSDCYSAEDVLDNLISSYNHLWMDGNAYTMDLRDIVEALDNGYEYYDDDTLEEWEDDEDEE